MDEQTDCLRWAHVSKCMFPYVATHVRSKTEFRVFPQGFKMRVPDSPYVKLWGSLIRIRGLLF